MAADLDLNICALVANCKFLEEQKNSWLVDLLYHATKHYDVKKAFQDCKTEGELVYDKLIEMAKKVERAKVNQASYKDTLP